MRLIRAEVYNINILVALSRNPIRKGVTMNITIVGRKCNPREDFHLRAEKRLSKVEKLFGEEANAKITATVEKTCHIVEITIAKGGMIYRAEEKDENMVDALDACVDSLIRQIRKNKTRLAKRLRTGAFDGGIFDTGEDFEEEPEEEEAEEPADEAAPAEEAAEEAEYVCDLLGREKLELPIFYDWEYLEGRAPTPGLLPMTECAVAFCEEVRDRGYTPGVYFNQDYGHNYLDLRELTEYTLWLAEYGDIPGFPYLYHMVQYTDSGSVSGIDGPVDLDLLFVDE